MQYVYLLRDGNGKVVDVGESHDPPSRLYHKTKNKPTPGHGYFYGRTDITQEVLSSWETKKEARAEEERLKIYYGLEVTERTGGIQGGRIGGLVPDYKQRKLTKEQADQIRSKYIPHKYSTYKLAKEYGVSPAAIKNIVTNKTYIRD
jgi:hypothetical protein